jgi:hypothetical protein
MAAKKKKAKTALESSEWQCKWNLPTQVDGQFNIVGELRFDGRLEEWLAHEIPPGTIWLDGAHIGYEYLSGVFYDVQEVEADVVRNILEAAKDDEDVAAIEVIPTFDLQISKQTLRMCGCAGLQSGASLGVAMATVEAVSFGVTGVVFFVGSGTYDIVISFKDGVCTLDRADAKLDYLPIKQREIVKAVDKAFGVDASSMF